MIKKLSGICLVLSSFLFPVLAYGQQPTPAPTPVAITIEPARFDAFVGQYEDAVNLGGSIFSFFREGDKFYLQVTNQDKIEVFPSAANHFFLREITADAEFVRDGSGRVSSVNFTQGRTFSLKRIADTPAKDTRVPYKRTEAMIPMRDGVKGQFHARRGDHLSVGQQQVDGLRQLDSAERREAETLSARRR